MREKIVEIAENEIGYLEKKSNSNLEDKTENAGNKNYTKYGAWYGMQAQPWCAMFVSWCAEKAGISTEIVPKHASCTAGINWFKNRNLWGEKGSYVPQKGDIIYFESGDSRHVGIVTDCDGEKVYTVEGNTSGGNTMIANGGEVAAKSYNLGYSKILGYGTPEYKELDEMTYEKFLEYMEKYNSDKKNEEPSAWSEDARKWAEDNELILGYEDGKMGYKAPLTREEYVEMEYRKCLEAK